MSRSESHQLLPCGRRVRKESGSGVHDKVATQTLIERLTSRLNAYLAENQLNRSEAREKILETIVRHARHFTVSDLLTHLSREYPEVGRATLYRTIPVLVESQIIQEGPLDADRQPLYELSDDHHHDHIVCLRCRHIFEFHDESIEARQKQIARQLGFQAAHHRHVVYAECRYPKK